MNCYIFGILKNVYGLYTAFEQWKWDALVICEPPSTVLTEKSVLSIERTAYITTILLIKTIPQPRRGEADGKPQIM